VEGGIYNGTGYKLKNPQSYFPQVSVSKITIQGFNEQIVIDTLGLPLLH